ncbi:Phosphatidylglycerol/phosphatidylinositol transfer protein [Thelotrema lepadinum]|nr:Phosphatidylglycerol/phosphatidylinositol transfer protein [Thelotrema lepadinum]
MKVFTSLAILLLSSFASADLFGLNQHALGVDDKSLSVPGDNPLNFCEDPAEAKHILLIEKVDLDPNPPEAGQKLTIKATGNFTEEVEEGAYAMLTVKFGSITLIRRREDLCEQMKNVDKECPLEKGETTITRDVDLPKQIPPGTFTVTADAFTKDDEKITCLVTTINFGKKNEL